MRRRISTGSGSLLPTPTSVRSRIILAFTLVTVLLLAVIGGATWLAREHQDTLAEVDRHSRQSELLAEARDASTTQLAITLLYVATGDESFLDELTTTEQKTLSAISEYLDLAQQAGEKQEIQAFQEIVSVGLPLTAAWNQAITAASEGDTETAVALVAGSKATMDGITVEFDALMAREGDEVARLRSQASTTADIAFWMLLGSGVVGLTAAVAAAYFLARSVLRPISSLQIAAHSVSSGNLEARAPEDGPRELAAVGTAFNEMTEALLDASKRRELEQERERSHRELAEAHARLEETTSRLNGVLTSIDDVIYAVTPNTLQVLYLNESVNALYGRSASDFKESSALWAEVAHPDDRHLVAALYANVREHGYAQDEYRIVRPDGEVRWVRARMRLVTNEHGIPVRIDGISTDITAERKAEEALTESEERFRALIQNAQDIITVLKPDGTIDFESPSLQPILGYSPDELIGKGAFEYIHPDDATEAAQKIAAGLQNPGEPQKAQFRFRHKNGSWRYLESIGSAIESESGLMLIVNSRDVTERKEAEELIAHMAYHDALTGLPNRLYLQDSANVALAQAQRSGTMVGVLSIDLDYLKKVNDTYGHPSGDELLKSAAERLNASVREGDTVARVGGDEFLAIVTQCSSTEDAEAAASRIVEAFRKPFLASGAKCDVTVSVGLSAFPQDGQDLKELIRKADAAMYRAKEGRDGYRIYSPELDEQKPSEPGSPAVTGAADRS